MDSLGHPPKMCYVRLLALVFGESWKFRTAVLGELERARFQGQPGAWTLPDSKTHTKSDGQIGTVLKVTVQCC